MRMRVIFAVAMALLFIAGTWSAAICEMTCMPQAQAGACCPHQMQHCKSTGAASLTNAHQCDYQQDNSATIAITNVVTAPFIVENSTMGISIRPSISAMIFAHDSASGLRHKPFSKIPLRI